MKTLLKSTIVLLIMALSLPGCSSSPEQQDDHWNTADEQRSRSKQAQDELSSETSDK